MTSRASGLMARSPNVSCLIGSQYGLSAGSGSAFSFAKAAVASKAAMAIEPACNNAVIALPRVKVCKVYAVIVDPRSPAALFPLEFDVCSGDIAAMEKVKRFPVARFGQAHLVGG